MEEQPFIVQVDSPEGPIFVEATTASTEGLVDTEAVLSLDEVTRLIRSVASSIIQAVRNLAPDKFTTEFGISVKGETGKLQHVIVGKASGEASIKVTLEWSKD